MIQENIRVVLRIFRSTLPLCATVMEDVCFASHAPFPNFLISTEMAGHLVSSLESVSRRAFPIQRDIFLGYSLSLPGKVFPLTETRSATFGEIWTYDSEQLLRLRGQFLWELAFETSNLVLDFHGNKICWSFIARFDIIYEIICLDIIEDLLYYSNHHCGYY